MLIPLAVKLLSSLLTHQSQSTLSTMMTNIRLGLTTISLTPIIILMLSASAGLLTEEWRGRLIYLKLNRQELRGEAIMVEILTLIINLIKACLFMKLWARLTHLNL